jgi:hypothetical protein
MKKISILILLIIFFVSSNTTLFAKRKEQYDEKVVRPTVTISPAALGIETEQADPATENPIQSLPDQAMFVKSVDDAQDVATSINKFLEDRINQTEFYEFLDEDIARTLGEEISDIKTKMTRIEDGLDGMEIETFNADMPEIQNELKSINKECLALNDAQMAIIIEELHEYYLSNHEEFSQEAISLYEEYQDFMEEKSEIRDLLDEIEELIINLSDKFDNSDWENLDDKEKDLMKLLNSEATRHKTDQ